MGRQSGRTFRTMETIRYAHSISWKINRAKFKIPAIKTSKGEDEGGNWSFQWLFLVEEVAVFLGDVIILSGYRDMSW